MIRPCIILVWHGLWQGQHLLFFWPKPSEKRNPQIIRSILLMIRLCLVHLKPFLHFLSHIHSRKNLSSDYTHFTLLSVSSLFMADEFHCYPSPGLVFFSFYAPYSVFSFHRFQSLIVYCIIIMHTQHSRKIKRKPVLDVSKENENEHLVSIQSIWKRE